MEGYLFIGDLAAAQLAAGRWSSDPRRRGVDCPIVGFLGMQGGAVPVDAFAMQALFAAHDAGTFSSGQPIDRRINPLRIGDEVRVLKGPFTYLDAIVLKVLKGDDVEIQLELFGSKRVAKVGLDSVALKP